MGGASKTGIAVSRGVMPVRAPRHASARIFCVGSPAATVTVLRMAACFAGSQSFRIVSRPRGPPTRHRYWSPRQFIRGARSRAVVTWRASRLWVSARDRRRHASPMVWTFAGSRRNGR